MGPTTATRPSILHATALALSTLAGTTGCFHQVSEEVLVRDPSQVSVLRADGTVSLHAGETGAAVHKEGEFGRPFLTTPYSVLVERGAEGNVGLRCEACMATWWARGSSATLVTAEGVVGPWTGVRGLSSTDSALTIGPEEVHLSVPRCLLQGKRCQVPVETLLSTPRENVLEIRSRRATVPAIGALLLGMGAVDMLAGTTVAAGVFPRIPPAVRAAVAAPVITLGGSFSAAGIWHLVSPPREQVTHLDPAGE
jgi:hypothetical protein